MSAPEKEQPVITAVEGNTGIIRLNRPAALNALNLEMVEAALAALAAFQADASVSHILLEGVGERAFCAGGDIRFVAESGKAGDGRAEEFWRQEYRLNLALADAAKPVITLMDGITMGGGAGLGINVAHRVVTDRTRFAMPEVGIGFIPDVGATWLLARAPAETGRYIALTGDTIGPADVIHAGLADVHVPAASLPELRSALVAATAAEISTVLQRFATRPEPGLFAEHEAAIAWAFRHDSVADIVEALSTRSSDFVQATARTISRRSPRSLLVTMELLRLAGRASNLRQCLLNEFHAACRCLAAPDYYEGVRAAVIDKDRNPRWQAENLAAAGPLDPEDMAPVPGVADPDFDLPLSDAATQETELPPTLRGAH